MLGVEGQAICAPEHGGSSNISDRQMRTEERKGLLRELKSRRARPPNITGKHRGDWRVRAPIASNKLHCSVYFIVLYLFLNVSSCYIT